jgi:hypothetical protein
MAAFFLCTFTPSRVASFNYARQTAFLSVSRSIACKLLRPAVVVARPGTRAVGAVGGPWTGTCVENLENGRG